MKTKLIFVLLFSSLTGFAGSTKFNANYLTVKPSKGQSDAETQLANAVSKAKVENKKVFLRFSAVWCGHCTHMQSILDRPNMKAIFGGEFVDIKIDIEKTPKGRQLYIKYAGNGAGVPWFAFLDTNGATLSTSVGPHGNIGCPEAPEEVAFFVNNLKNATKLSSEQLAQVEAAFKKL